VAPPPSRPGAQTTSGGGFQSSNGANGGGGHYDINAELAAKAARPRTIGYVNSDVESGQNSATISGWACQPAGTAIKVHVYVGAPYPVGKAARRLAREFKIHAWRSERVPLVNGAHLQNYHRSQNYSRVPR
jgi:hypothetical protein